MTAGSGFQAVCSMAHDREAVMARVFAEMMEGRSLKQICEADDMPHRDTVHDWLAKDAALSDKYARAAEVRADLIFDEILEITDDARNDWMVRHGQDDAGYAANGEHIQRARLRVDARKWMLGKMNPKKYGDKIDHNHSGGVTVNITGDDAKL